MMKCALAAAVIGAAAHMPVAAVPADYRLVWGDEFHGSALDPKKWEYRYLGNRDGTNVSKDAVRLDGEGYLVLSTFMRDGRIHVGMIGTQPTFQARYGYFEARIRFQRLQGHHGAFWLQSPVYGKYRDDPARSGAEIDVIEYFGSGRADGGASINIHWNPYSNPSSRKFILGVLRPHADFRVYALHWTAAGYEFFLDGERVFATRDGLSHVCQYLILSLLSSLWERHRLPVNALPDAMVVDYVRVYADPKQRSDCPAS